MFNRSVLTCMLKYILYHILAGLQPFPTISYTIIARKSYDKWWISLSFIVWIICITFDYVILGLSIINRRPNQTEKLARTVHPFPHIRSLVWSDSVLHKTDHYASLDWTGPSILVWSSVRCFWPNRFLLWSGFRIVIRPTFEHLNWYKADDQYFFSPICAN